MKIDRPEALRRAREVDRECVAWSSCEAREAIIAAAIEQAVRETAEECAGIVGSKWAYASVLLIRAEFGLEDKSPEVQR